MAYQIWTKSGDSMGLVKTYPFKIQAIIWCYMHGFVSCGSRYTFLDDRVKIVEVE